MAIRPRAAGALRGVRRRPKREPTNLRCINTTVIVVINAQTGRIRGLSRCAELRDRADIAQRAPGLPLQNVDTMRKA
jgi:hypothetical protein